MKQSLVKNDAQLIGYSGGDLQYEIRYEDEDGTHRSFLFPITVIDSTDTGGTFGRTEKGITLMRWIRKHLDFLREAKADLSGDIRC